MSVRAFPVPLARREITLRFRRDGGAQAAEIFGSIPRTDDDLVRAAAARVPSRERRQRVLGRLVPEWGAMDLPAASRASLETLRKEPLTALVLAGQQPALAGGPLHLLAKALSAARLARRLTNLGIPAVPLFWIASDDHDVGELFSGAYPRAGGAAAVEIANPFAVGRVPIRKLRLPAGAEPLLREVEEALPEGGGGVARRETLALLRRTADPSPARWFANWLLAALPGEGLLPVSADGLRAEAAPRIRAELALPRSLAADVSRDIERLRALGHSVPIENPATPPVFFHDDAGARHRMELTADGGFRVRDESGRHFTTDALSALVDSEPERFSPDALLRPIVQDELLEPVAAVLGPTELAYHLELGGAYVSRGVTRPVLMPRLRVRLLDDETAGALTGAGIDLAAIDPERKPEDLAPSPRARRLVEDLNSRAAAFAAWLTAVAAEERGSGALDKRLTRLAGRMEDDARKLAAVIERDVYDDVKDIRRHLHAAWRALWPDGKPAERTFAAVYYLARYGLDLPGAIGDIYDPYDERERVLVARAARSALTE